MSLTFEDPPRTTRTPGQRGKHEETVRELRDRPREWAIVGVYGTGGSAAAMARHIKKATLGAYGPAGAFEAVARTVGGEARVYARYVGESDG